jgi:hypothetical protein
VDRAVDATAKMLADLSDYLLEDKKTAQTRALFYALGKWIYLIDALDDYDKDKKKGAYNPFVLSYKVASKKQLFEKYQKEVEFTFYSIFYEIRELLPQIKFHFNRDLCDNILLRGLPTTTKRIMAGLPCACTKKEIKSGK